MEDPIEARVWPTCGPAGSPAARGAPRSRPGQISKATWKWRAPAEEGPVVWGVGVALPSICSKHPHHQPSTLPELYRRAVQVIEGVLSGRYRALCQTNLVAPYTRFTCPPTWHQRPQVMSKGANARKNLAPDAITHFNSFQSPQHSSRTILLGTSEDAEQSRQMRSMFML